MAMGSIFPSISIALLDFGSRISLVGSVNYGTMMVNTIRDSLNMDCLMAKDALLINQLDNPTRENGKMAKDKAKASSSRTISDTKENSKEIKLLALVLF